MRALRSAGVQLTPDRRFVHVNFVEETREVEGIEKVKVVVDLVTGKEAAAEIVSLKESTLSKIRYIPDGRRH